MCTWEVTAGIVMRIGLGTDTRCRALTDLANTGVNWGLIPRGPSEELYKMHMASSTRKRQRILYKPREEALTQTKTQGRLAEQKQHTACGSEPSGGILHPHCISSRVKAKVSETLRNLECYHPGTVHSLTCFGSLFSVTYLRALLLPAPFGTS